MLPSRTRPSCTDSTGHCTDDTRRAGIIWRIGPLSTPALVARVTELVEAGRTNQEIAYALNAKGIPTAQADSRFTGGQVRTLISQHNIRGQRKGRPALLIGLPPGQWSVPGLSAELGMPTAAIYNWIYRGWITARHAPGSKNWIITADDQQIRERGRRTRPSGFYTCAPLGTASTRTRQGTRNNHKKAAQLDRYQRCADLEVRHRSLYVLVCRKSRGRASHGQEHAQPRTARKERSPGPRSRFLDCGPKFP
jgi:hypothetical protein